MQVCREIAAVPRCAGRRHCTSLRRHRVRLRPTHELLAVCGKVTAGLHNRWRLHRLEARVCTAAKATT